MLLQHDQDGAFVLRHDLITRLAAVLVLCSVLLSSCAPSPAPSALRAVTDTVPPCWHTICPGKTTIDSIEEALESVPEVGGVETYLPAAEDQLWLPHTVWVSPAPITQEYVSGICYYRDGVVIFCEMTTIGLRLRHLVELRGEPEAVSFVEDWADRRMLTYWILYPDAGLAAVHLDVNWRSGEAIELRPNMGIDAFYIFRPDSYREIVGGPVFFMFGPLHDEIERARRPWQGYGVYEYEAP